MVASAATAETVDVHGGRLVDPAAAKVLAAQPAPPPGRNGYFMLWGLFASRELDPHETGQIAECGSGQMRNELDPRLGDLPGFGALHHRRLMRRVDALRVWRTRECDWMTAEDAMHVVGTLNHVYPPALRDSDEE